MYKILLACGAGASSGFVALSMRKSAKKLNIKAEIKAVSDIEIMNYVDDFDILLLGPHIKYKLAEIEAELIGRPVKVLVMDKKRYGALDGAGILEDALAAMQE